jgi:hypothetical protein
VGIKTNLFGELDYLRPEKVEWELAISGYWGEDMYHNGHIAYYVAKVGPGLWLLDGVERHACLDSVDEDDVENGCINDDQLQAMHGMTLEEAQTIEFRSIVAVCDNVAEAGTAKEMASRLYKAVCIADGKEITEFDGIGCLLDYPFRPVDPTY